MLVVADSSPFVGLLKIGHIDLLPRLYGSVVIPPQIADELADARRPIAVREFMSLAPPWLSIRAPAIIEDIPMLGRGERAAISLAFELRADVLLIDENRGREAAIARNIRTLRTTALPYDAAKAGALPDLKAAFDRLKNTNFRVPRGLLDELLKLYDAFKDQSERSSA
jgi:predicted nucleic acid-binding protein